MRITPQRRSYPCEKAWSLILTLNQHLKLLPCRCSLGVSYCVLAILQNHGQGRSRWTPVLLCAQPFHPVLRLGILSHIPMVMCSAVTQLFSAAVREDAALPCRSPAGNRHLCCCWIGAVLLHFCAFGYWFCYLKCACLPTSTVLECCPLFLGAKMTVVCLMDKIHVRLTSFSRESHSAVYCKLGVIEVTSLNRVTHHKYTQRHKTRFVMISSQKC